MPLIAGSLNFAWEINALLLSRGFYGHVLWTGLDVLIVFHNVRFLEKGKRKKYLLLIVVFYMECSVFLMSMDKGFRSLP